MSSLNAIGKTIVDENGRLGRVTSVDVTWVDGQMQKIVYNLHLAKESQENQYDEQMFRLLDAKNAAIAQANTDLEYFRHRYNHIVGKKPSSCPEKMERRNAKLATVLVDLTKLHMHLVHLLQEKERIFENFSFSCRSKKENVSEDEDNKSN